MHRSGFVLIVLAAALVSGLAGEARAGLPAAGSDDLPFVAIIQAQTGLGVEAIALTGWGRIERAEPRVEGGAQVVDLELVELHLSGAAGLGIVDVAVRAGRASVGAIVSEQPDAAFPASTFIDLYLDIALPDSQFGPLAFTNDEALRVVPRAGGEEVAIDAWPPLGVSFGLVPAGGGDPPCVLLTKDDANPDGVDLCLTDLRIDVAPQLPSYSVERGGPSAFDPAAVFGLTPRGDSPPPAAPFLGLSCLGLGLTADGCGAEKERSQAAETRFVSRDDVNALSFGDDLTGAGPEVGFSVGHGARGVPGSGVAAQAACPPADPGFNPEPEPDEFRSLLDGTNTLLLDGNGPIGACVSAFPLGLLEGFLVRDDLDALDAHDRSVVDDDGDGAPDRAVYFSLDAFSPSLPALGASAAAVLRTAGGGPASVFASAAQLGLRAGDDLDALCLRENGDGSFGPGDAAVFSLAPGSPTLAAIGAGPGDLLVAGVPPKLVLSAAALGLLATDDVDALTCASLGSGGDGDCDGEISSIDAALVLQHNAGLLASLPCQDDADVNRDGVVNSVDAALILQMVAGLLDIAPQP